MKHKGKEKRRMRIELLDKWKGYGRCGVLHPNFDSMISFADLIVALSFFLAVSLHVAFVVL